MEQPFNSFSYPNWAAPYVEVARGLAAETVSLSAVSAHVSAALPPLDEIRLDKMALLIEAAGLAGPRHGWAVAAVTDAAVRQMEDDPFLQARAAWLLARAANEWARPELAAEALDRAEPLFADLGQRAWTAACLWQRNFLPWTRPNFPQAAAELTQAAAQLRGTELEDLMPHCCLSLAYARLLTGDFEAALGCVEESERIFEAEGDAPNQARCWLTRSSVLRRQDESDQSLAYLEQALGRFQELSAPVEAAKTYYQLAHLNLAAENDYTAAEHHFQRARNLFAAHQMPLWVAMCNHALGQVDLESGRVAEAGQKLQKARKTLADFDIRGAQGDALFDSAKYARLVGDHATAVRYLQRAEAGYNEVGAAFMAALAAMHLGSTYREWGFHQLALHHLERAQQALLSMNSPGRLAECHMRLAHLWLQINQPDEAMACLEQAVTYYEAAQRPAYLATVYGRQAEAAMLAGENDQAVRSLEKAAALAAEHKLGPQIADAQRLLGECLCIAGNPEAGLPHLHRAAAGFSAMGLVFDRAGCLVALGNGLVQSGETAAARQAWQEALDLNRETVPAVSWRAKGGLARLAEREGNIQEALGHYRPAIKALNRQRRDFWQPDLAGGFLQSAALLIDQAVALAVNNGADEDALQFVEAGKAQTVARRLLRGPAATPRHTPPPDLLTAAAEIQNLYERIHAQYEKESFRQDARVEALIGLLPEKIESYRAIRSRWERQHLQESDLPFEDELDIGRFCRLADKHLDGPWLALSYYLTEDDLYVVALMDGVCRSWRRPLTSYTWSALEACKRARTNGPQPTTGELAALGRWLIPEEIATKLTPETTLLLAPHRELHHLPWSALLTRSEPLTGDEQRPLVAACIPVIVPALYCLSLLWRREGVSPPRADGLLVGASEFPGRHKRPLPQVNKELTHVAAQLSENGRTLVGDEASWEMLRSLAGEEGLARFAFCHIAGHASFDSLTGRLSGISFYDRDVWLDELRDCAPWPRLLTMAACNSSQSLVHEGDEPVGLTTTFLAAGADTIAGSIWPVRDEDAAALLTGFYDHFLDGRRPSEALALVQRQAIDDGQTISRWGSFVCVGRP